MLAGTGSDRNPFLQLGLLVHRAAPSTAPAQHHRILPVWGFCTAFQLVPPTSPPQPARALDPASGYRFRVKALRFIPRQGPTHRVTLAPVLPDADRIMHPKCAFEDESLRENAWSLLYLVGDALGHLDPRFYPLDWRGYMNLMR